MATTSITPDQDAVVAEIQIAAPPERVFSALSDRRQLEQWFSNPECPAKLWEMDARAGGSYQIREAFAIGRREWGSRFQVPRRNPGIRSAAPARLHLERELARHAQQFHCALGTHANEHRHAGTGDAQRSEQAAGCTQRIRWRLDRSCERLEDFC